MLEKSRKRSKQYYQDHKEEMQKKAVNRYHELKNEYLESLEIANIIKETARNKNESTKMITQDEIFNYLENKIKSSKDNCYFLK